MLHGSRDPQLTRSRSGKLGRAVAFFFGLVFAAGGIAIGLEGLREGLAGEWKQALGGLVFFVVFGGIGIGAIYFAIWGADAERKPKGLEAAYPNEPWLWREEWARGRIPSGGKRTLVVAWIMALGFSACSVPLLWVIPEEVTEKDNLAALLGLVFPLASCGLLVWALRATVRWLKFGESIFELKTLPGVIGGAIEGTVHTRATAPEGGFRVKLVCLNRVTSGSGDSRSTTEHIRWQEEHTVDRGRVGREVTLSAIPVRFLVPFDCEATNHLNPNNEILWRLEVSAETPGVDYSARFEVPVFKTSASSPEVTGDEIAVAAVRVRSVSTSGAALPGSRVRIRPIGFGGTEFRFGAMRNSSAAASLTGFTVIWLATIPLQRHFGAPIIFPIVTALVGVLLVWGSLSLWFGVTRVRVEYGSLRIKSGLFGLGRERTYAASEIAKIEPRIGMQWGTTPYYDIRVTLTGGSAQPARRRSRTAAHRTAGGNIRDKREAEALAAAMTRLLERGA